MKTPFYRILLLALVCSLASCSTLNLQKPGISLISFEPQPLDGLEASFNIVLKISNPNSVTLPLKGMSYEFILNDEPLLKGVNNNLPAIPAYGEERVTLTVGTNLLSTSKLVLKLINKPETDFRYQLKSRLDMKGVLPSFNVIEEGILPLK